MSKCASCGIIIEDGKGVRYYKFCVACESYIRAGKSTYSKYAQPKKPTDNLARAIAEARARGKIKLKMSNAKIYNYLKRG